MGTVGVGQDGRQIVLLAPRAWGKLRAQILERDGYRCKVVLPDKCTGRAECVHHTLGRWVTGDDPRYLVAACNACNLAIGDPRKRPDPEPLPFVL